MITATDTYNNTYTSLYIQHVENLQEEELAFDAKKLAKIIVKILNNKEEQLT